MESNEVETTSLLNHEAAKPQPFEPADVSGSEVENPAFTDVPLDLDALQAETDRLQGETRTFKRIRTEDVEETGETEGTEKGSDLVEERADAVAGDSEGDENGPASDILDISRGEVPVTLEDSPKNPRRDLEESESRPSPRRTPSTSSHPGEGSKPLDSDDQISNGDETNEDEDPEPLLKYSRLGGNLVSLLAKDTVSSIRVSDRFLAIGTHGGHVHILDLAGNEIKRFRAHAASVTELALDDRADYLASASDDGRVVVHSLFSAESAAFDFRRPIKAVALEPDYARSSSRTIITGGRNEHVIMASKSWFGSMANTTIHSGEGAIFCIKWCGDMVAWANEYGVQLYHFPSSRRIGHVKRRKGSPRADLYRPHLFWKNQSELLIGWANSVTIVTIRSSGNGASAVPSADPSAARDWEAKAPGDNLMPEITASFKTDYIVCGVAPLRKDNVDMVVLLTIDVDPALLNADALPSTAARTEHNAPEIRIVDRVGNEVANDVLASVPGYQFYQPNDYRLDYLDFDQTFYVVSPKDVIVARPRDLADHIEWLLERQRYEEALHAAENAGDDYSVKGRLKVDDIIEIGQKYLHALVAQEKYEEAAALCPKILWQDLNLWQQWVFTFADHGHLAALAPHIPTIKPRLPPNVYETILEFALSNNASLYLDLVKRWPSSVFDVEREIASVEEKLGGHAQQIVLMEAAMELNGSAKHWDKYLAFALRLGIPNAVAVVSRHNLFHLLSDEIIQLLLEYDERLLDTDGEFAARIEQDLALEDGGPGLTRHDFPSLTTPVGRVRAAVFCPGVQLLVDAADKVQPSTVVTALKEFSGFLFIYLDALWRKERQRRDIRQDGAPYHTLLVELYAEYDPERLLAFLRSSGSYSVSKAYEICQDRDMVPEMVYLLGKMGDNKKALALIIERMADVAGAISFAKDQNDPALWEDLLTYSMDKPPFILGLLENMGSSALDPAAVVRRIPDDLAITGLKGAICHLFEDYGVQFYLQEGCEKIVQQDALALLESLLRQRSRGSLVEFRDITCSICSLPILQDLVGSTGQDGAIILFSCRHWFHSGCLLTRSGDASQDAYAAESREDLLFALRRRVGPVYGRTEQPFLVMETKEEPIPRLTSEIFRLRRRIMDLSLWCPICDDLEIGGRGSVGKLFKSEDEIRKAQ